MSLSLPTSAGSAPKLAASKNTNAVCVANATTTTCGAVSPPASHASGTLSSTAATAKSIATIIARRSSRSASAPASSPNTRYGNASAAVTAAVQPADPVTW
ncbi:hypothetical protein SAMN05421507_11874 [Lentzea jiangxiensis]|uniref:Uncharacterized protein n=1 Tax=Lentzea jiangxiensis TaxID=641025 RepID=A0A1H0WCC7_9PSEU|nr:hypothetical protein SAMN05421507_11874 [Lentzea jiangxiensis]